MVAGRRASIRRFLLGVIAAAFALSIPWYRSGGDAAGRWLGLPDWVAVALGAYVVVAVLNAAAWLLTDVPDGDEPGDDG